MGLAKSYSKEIIRELEKIPVYLPGSAVKVGDIISFGRGLLRSRPFGSFSLVTNLKNLDVSFETELSPTTHPYKFSSSGSVSVEFQAEGQAANLGEGKLEINFSKEGATFFSALGCSTEFMSDTAQLEAALEPIRDKVDWRNCYIVTSVTTAKRAIIMQSSSSKASLTIKGNVKGLQTNNDLNVDLDASVHVSAQKDAAFIKDWSQDVTVFFTLARYKKRVFGDWEVNFRSASLLKENSDDYVLMPLELDDLLGQ